MIPVVLSIVEPGVQVAVSCVVDRNGWSVPTSLPPTEPMEILGTYRDVVGLLCGSVPLRRFCMEGTVSGSIGQLSLLTFCLGRDSWTDWIGARAADAMHAVDSAVELLKGMGAGSER